MNRRDFIKCGAVLGTAVVGRSVAASALQQSWSRAEASYVWGRDLAVVNAKILTLEPEQPEAEAALVRRGRIVFVGSSDAVEAQAGDAPRFDAGGQLVVPGFIDAHCHLEVACAYETYQIDIHTPPLESLDQIVNVLAARASNTPAGAWLIARGSFGLARRVSEGRLLTRQDLDSVTEDHPLIAFSGRHVAMLNTRALRELGLWDQEAKAPPGATVYRNAAGLPTGIATELYYLLPSYSSEQVQAALKAHARNMFVAKGTTSVSTVPYSIDDIRADLELQASGELPLRIRMYYHVPHMISLDGLLATGFISGVGSDMFRFGGMKIFVDGLGGDGFGNYLEDFKWTQEELNELVYRCHAAGIQVLMHVITDAAVERAATAVELAQDRDPRPHRHRLEHGADVETPEGMRRLRELGLRLVATPSAGRPGRRTPRYRTLVEEGFELIGITDTTGTVPGSSDPLRKMAYASVSVEQGGGAPVGEEVSFEDALRMYTIWAARGGFEEQDKGSIAIGKLGDFAVLSTDPRGRDKEELFDLKVDATILGGEVVFER